MNLILFDSFAISFPPNILASEWKREARGPCSPTPRSPLYSAACPVCEGIFQGR